MSTLNDDDLFTVQQAATGTTGAVANSNRSTLEDEDLFVVYRPSTGLNYKVASSDVGGGPTEAPTISSVVLTQDQTNANRFTSNSFTTTVTADQEPTSLKLRAEVTGALGIEAGTDLITSNPYPGTSSSSVALTLNSDGNLGGGVFDVGDVVKANESYTPETDTISSVVAFEALGTWSKVSGTTSSTPNEPVAGFNNIWNDNPNSKAYFNYTNTSSQSSRYKFTFTTPIPFTKLEAYVGAYDGSPTAWVGFNGGTAIRGGTNTGTPVKVDFTTNANSAAGATTGLLESFEIGTNSANYGYIGQILVDDVPLTNAIKTLTFPTEKDIKLFQVDDVVQSDYTDGVKWDSTQSGQVSNPTRALDGNDNTFAVADGSGGEFLYIDIPSDNSTIEVLVENPTGTSSPFYIQNGDGYNNDQGVWNPGTTGWVVASRQNQIEIPANSTKSWITYTNTATDKSIARLYFNTANSGIRVYSIKANGTASEGVKVTATDVSAKTITVDGGTWDTTNRSQVWSDLVTNPGGTLSGSVENGFNGVLAAPYATYFGGAFPANCAELAIPILASDTVFVICQSDVQPFLVDAGNGTQSFGTTSGANTRIDISSAFGTNVTSWKMGSTGNWNFAGIEVNGKILVDAVNDSSVWSLGLSLPDGIASGTYANQFDGNLSTYANPASASNSWSWLCPETIVLTENIKLKPPFVENFNYTWGIGGNSGSSITITDTGWYELLGTEGKTVSPNVPLVIGSNTSSVAPKFTGMMLNGILLVDQGVRDLGDTKVSTSVPKQGQGTISDITGSVVTIDPYTDNCFIEGQYLIHATPKSIKVTPRSDSISTVAGNVLTLSGNKDLLQFANGDAVTMVNADGTAATYDATTSAITGVGTTGWTMDPDPSKSNLVLSNGNQTYTSANGWRTGLSTAILSKTEETYFEFKLRNDANNNGDHRFGILKDNGGYVPGDGAQVIKPGNFEIIGYGCTAGDAVSTDLTGRLLVKQNDTVKSQSTIFGQPFGGTDGPNDVIGFRVIPAENKVIAYKNGVEQGDLVAAASNNLDATFNITTGDWRIYAGKYSNQGFVDSGENVILTFTNNTNLQYFKDGDVVGSETVPVTDVMTQSGDGSTGTDGIWRAAFDGTTATQSGIGNYTWIFQEPLTGSPGVWASSSEVYSPDNGGVDYLHNGTWTWTDLSNSKDGVPRFYSLPSPIEGIRIKQSSSTNYGNVAGVATDSTQPNTTLITFTEENVDITVVGTPTLSPPQMVVSGGTWSNGNTITKSISGTGTVDTVNPANNTITLSTNNGEWVPGYNVQTPEKDAVAMTAYLSFDSNGNNVELERLPQSAVLMGNITSPTLTFPAQFSTNEAPDTDIPYPSYLQTYATSGNLIGESSEVASNILFPEWNARTIPAAGSFRYTTEEFGDFCRWACSANYRSAIVTIQQSTETINDLRNKATKMAQDYINSQS